MKKVEQLFFDEGVEMGIAKGIARGRVKGAAEGRAELIGCIRKKLKKGYAVIEIAEVLELEALYVRRIADLIQNEPEDSDVEIAEKESVQQTAG